MNEWFARRPFLASLCSTGSGVLVALAIGELAGLRDARRVFVRAQPWWLIPAAVAQAISVLAYIGAYRGVVATTCGARPGRRITAELVFAGFGPFAVSSGFSLDRRTLTRLGLDARRALRTVLDLGGVEFMSLIWLAAVAALVSLLAGPALPGSFTWPWLAGVPAGTIAAALVLRRWISAGRPAPQRRLVAELLVCLEDVLGLARHPWRSGHAWGAAAVYWILDIATLYWTLRAVGLAVAPVALALAYATGYLLSRRSLPLAGAGFVMLLVTFSLYWLGEPLAPTLVGVVFYRLVAIAMAAAPGFIARARLERHDDLGVPLEAPVEIAPTTAGERSPER